MYRFITSNFVVIHFKIKFELLNNKLFITFNCGKRICFLCILMQGTKKFRSDSPGLVDFVVGLVEFILHLPDRQVKVFVENFL